jgi:translation initiation factor 2D
MSFRKNVTISGTHILGGKDVKKLKADLAKAFPSLSDDDRDALLPPKAAVAQLKLSTRAVAYALEGGNPLLFDPNGRGDKLLPTVYALALLPAMLPVLHTYSEVSPKVLGGADPFLQGLLLPEGGAPPDFLAGSARALAVPGNPVPFAVGVMAVSGAEAVREEMKGRGLTVLHSFGDLLWALGDEEPPNEGFTPARVFPLDGAASSGAAPAADAGVDADAAAEALQGAALGDSSGAAGAESPAADGAADPADDNGATAGAGAAAAVDMDALLEAAALGGLRSLKTSELPIMSSDFYSKHMQPLKPQGVFFDFKASKYKKLSKLLDRLEKDKVLTQKQIRKQDHISGVDRSHPAYVAWAGMPGGAPAGEAADDDGGANGGGGGATAASGCQGQGSTRVESLFKVPGSLRAVFGEGSDKESLYSEAQVAQALSDYAQANGALEARVDGVLKRMVVCFFFFWKA